MKLSLLVFTLFLALSFDLGAEAAQAQLQEVKDVSDVKEIKINGLVLTKETQQDEPSREFSATEGLALARSSRNAKLKKERHDADAGAENCFRLLRNTAEAGECSKTFWAEDAKCAEEEQSGGCFENKQFQRKLGRLGFKVTKKAKEGGDCNLVTAQWCQEVKDEEAQEK
jgi:hypothetical protein